MSNRNDKKLNWPGWPLSKNLFGEEFDLAARKRMVAGSEMLIPFLKKHVKNPRHAVLEVGPFFNPLVTPEDFPDAKIFYWENDDNVLKYLSKKYAGSCSTFCDLNKIDEDSLSKLKAKMFPKKYDQNEVLFDAVVISHVFNYIDYKRFLRVLKCFIKKDGLIFINNVVNYGLPIFFSDERPKSIQETIRTVKETGFDIIDKKVFKSPNKKYQKNKRLILVARNNNK